jgi:hypothetical protein
MHSPIVIEDKEFTLPQTVVLHKLWPSSGQKHAAVNFLYLNRPNIPLSIRKDNCSARLSVSPLWKMTEEALRYLLHTETKLGRASSTRLVNPKAKMALNDDVKD